MNDMGRRRGGRFADRPENVELDPRGRITYFRYVFPDGTRKRIGSNEDSSQAFEAARVLNGHFAQQRLQVDIAGLLKAPKLVATPKNPTIPTLIAEFRKHDQKRKKYSERTLEEQAYRLNSYAKRWPDKTVKEVETTDISGFLNELTDNAYVKHRAQLLMLFQFAGHQGYIAINPVAVTLVKSESEKVRQRHTWEGYQKVLDAAPDWLKRAMRIGLYSLQRRDDVVLLHKAHNQVDLVAGTITILQRKTRNYANPVWLEIEMGSALGAAVGECLRSDILCPYLIHRKPDRQCSRERQTKPHPFAVTAGYLTKEFSRVRDEAKAYDHLAPEERPTFHELRGFGMHLYEEAGYSKEYIMALSGHATDAMYQRYTKDHAIKAPKRVSAGMSASDLPS